MKICRFAIHIDGYGDSEVEVKLTNKEAKKIESAIDRGDEDFCDNEKLADIYEKAEKAAREKLYEDVDLTGDDIDVEDLDFVVDFQDYPEDE